MVGWEERREGEEEKQARRRYCVWPTAFITIRSGMGKVSNNVWNTWDRIIDRAMERNETKW